jgi:acyl carrier protein
MNTLETLQQLIQKKYGIEPAALDINASIRGHGLDSLALVEFLFEIEDHFGVSLPDSFNAIDTLAEFAAALDVTLATRNADAAAAPPPATSQVA